MYYSAIRHLLFMLPPERAHHLTLNTLALAHKAGILKVIFSKIISKPVKVMGLHFPNPVGLAAGLDKNGDYVDALGDLGFGFLEIGTLTPRPQPGNPKPRLFRLPDYDAIINRMGFNNKGIDHALDTVTNRKFNGPLGINVGKNINTPVDEAVNDYLIGIRKAYAYADYIAINVSSPNTPGLRTLQFGEIKIAPDINEGEITLFAKTALSQQIDGIIATNTTVSREAVKGSAYASERGGLSGLPLQKQSTQVISLLASELGGRIPIIGAGGIFEGQNAVDKINAGASLVQVYTGFLYRGPAIINDCINALAENGVNNKRPA